MGISESKIRDIILEGQSSKPNVNLNISIPPEAISKLLIGKDKDIEIELKSSQGTPAVGKAVDIGQAEKTSREPKPAIANDELLEAIIDDKIYKKLSLMKQRKQEQMINNMILSKL